MEERGPTGYRRAGDPGRGDRASPKGVPESEERALTEWERVWLMEQMAKQRKRPPAAAPRDPAGPSHDPTGNGLEADPHHEGSSPPLSEVRTGSAQAPEREIELPAPAQPPAAGERSERRSWSAAAILHSFWRFG